eukprot:sb/3473704/
MTLNLADQHLASWTYWDSDFRNDPERVSSPGQPEDAASSSPGQGGITSGKYEGVSVFARSYPQFTAGTPTYLSWSLDSAAMVLEYQIDPAITLPTVIVTPMLHYPDGLHVAVSGNLKYRVDRGVVYVYHKTGVKAGEVGKVAIARIG